MRRGAEEGGELCPGPRVHGTDGTDAGMGHGDTAWGGDAERAQTPRHAADIHGVGWGGICVAITLKGEVDEPKPKAFV